jgi:hypothetical protein
MQTWWVRTLLALAFLLLGYGFASLAINSGSLLEYAATIACVWYGFRNSLLAIRLGIFS